MTAPRLSASNYSNSAPLTWSFLYGTNRGKYELIMDNAPARSAQMLAEKRVDAALVPVIEYQRIDNVLLVPDVCVGAEKRVRSVCLITKGEDLERVETVALDVSSKTSVALGKIIFREFLNKSPVYKEAAPNADLMLDEADAALLIGDPALMVDENKYRKFDLAEIWKSYTNYGFVFAMWMANVENSTIARTINFQNARDEGLNHLDEIISNYKSEISLETKEFREYLAENICYTISDSMRKGLTLYFELAHKHNLIESRKPLHFLD